MRIFLLFLVLSALLVFIRLVALRLRPAPPKRPALPPKEEARRVSHRAGKLEVKHYWFGGFDARKGPANPDNFYEEMVVEVGEEGSSATRTVYFYVATTRALLNVVGMEAEQYAFVKNLIVVPRYDVELILRAVKEQVGNL